MPTPKIRPAMKVGSTKGQLKVGSTMGQLVKKFAGLNSCPLKLWDVPWYNLGLWEVAGPYHFAQIEE
jgi:hypothetical protein